MPREPELSIKVKVDPHVDPQQTRDTIQRKFNDIKNPPTVVVKPDLSKFDNFIKDDLGGDYPVDITPNITGDIKGKIKEEIDKAVKSPDFPKVPLKVDVGDFSNELSSALKKELKDVNDKLSYYLKNLTRNSDNLTGLVNDLLPTKNISAAGAKLSKEVSKAVNDATETVKKSVKPLTIDDLLNYKSKTTLTSIQKVKDSILQLKDSLTDLYTDEKYIDEDEQIIDVKGFQEKLRTLKSESKDLKKVLEGFSSTIGMKSVSSVFNNKDFNIEKTCSDLLELINVLDLISETPIFKDKSEAQDFSERLYANVGKYSSSLDTLCDSTISNLDKVSERSKEVIHEQDVLQRTQAQVGKKVESAKKEDSSGLLDSSSIKQYADSIDEALSQVSTKYEEINRKRKSAINLESTLLSKVKLNKESLKDELKEYSDILKNFDDNKLKGIADRAAAIQDSNVPAGDKKKPKETSKSKSKSASTTSVPNFPGAPNNKNESQSLIDDGIAKIKKVVFDVKQEDLQNSIDTIFAKVSAPIGFRPAEKAIENVRTELTNALKNIDFTLTFGKQNANGETTATATATSESQSTSDLKKQATSIANIKRNLEAVTTGIDKYVTDIASIGTAFEYSMSQVDSLNKALENQIIDLDLVAKKTDAYGTTANSISLNTKDVAVASDPVDIPGKVELKDKDIKRPNPLNINGAVKIKASDIKIDDVEISKKKFDINGNLILKNAEIVDAVKEATKEATRKAKPKQSTAKTKNGLTDRDFERKSKELLTSLASIMKGKARVQNSLTTHTRKGQSEAAQKAVEKSSIDMVNRVAKSIEESKKIYLDAEKEIIKRQAELLTTEDSATKQDIIDKISDAKNLKKTAGARINSYSGDYTGLVQNAWDEINSEKKSYKIDQSLANEQKSNKEIAATFDEIIGKYSKLDKLEQRRSKLFKPDDVQQLQDVDEAIVKLTDDITTLEIKALDSGIDLHANSDYSNKVAESSKISKESAVTFTNNKRTYDVNAAKESYLTNYKDWLQNMDYIDRIDPNSINAQELISRYQKRADENKQAIDAARQILSINNDISKDAWDEIQRWKDSLSITNAEKAAKDAQKVTDKKDSDDAAFFTKLQTAVNRKIKAYDDFMKAEPGTKDWVSKSGKNSIADNNLLDLQNQATATGLSSDQRYSSIMGQYRKDIDAVNEAQQKRAKIEEEATKVQDKDIISLQKFIKTVDAYKGSIEKDNKTDMPAYANVTNIRGSANDLLNRLRKDTSGDKDQVAID